VSEMPKLPVVVGHCYRRPVEGRRCEISIILPPQNIPPTRPFIDCCGHEMVKVSVDESYGWGARGER
jgi:hypothetical protein